ncbi:glycosyl hydrolase family 57 [candidate division KSB3 bacterium]|uniref:Glycosyl hydrolase family 57 n=1 Tax=candidate division KSB3 bacterium TaxID=2044937 RepID=A0A2G6KKR2_9BACT|nr:MAG: glycosyl hydrolase family 57 [candidate division KSB3 bacterium]
MIFNRIVHVGLPDQAEVGKGFIVTMETDGDIPFAQIIVRHADGWEWVVRDDSVVYEEPGRCRFMVPPEAYHSGTAYLQIEGCHSEDIQTATPQEWVIEHHQIEIQEASGMPLQPSPPPQDIFTIPEVTLGISRDPVIYFAIHKHMHQPYYDAIDTEYWDGEKEEIFGSRVGPYTRFIPAAVRQYIEGGLAHAGLSTSWSGSLIEQLIMCANTGQAYGGFRDWNFELKAIAQAKTAFGNPRVDFTAFGFFHPLMALIPHRDIVGQIEWHRNIVRGVFETEASDVLFPPETAFHPHMIPALLEAGVRAVIYDSIHHFRSCRNYPYTGAKEGMLPPNVSDQVNPEVDDWMHLRNIWGPSKISPQLLKPCMLSYTDHEGQRSDIIGIPAERYLGNEDARGGYGALLYEQVMGQVYDQIVKTGTYDPEHPPFFVLHSDGDNHGGGAESYYTCNTSRLVQMCQKESRFQLVTIKDYLHQFPVDPDNVVHLEPGSWAGADNGDPQFTKWFSMVEQDYSPDLNSWAVLTAFQNIVYSIEDSREERSLVHQLKRLLYTAETSCYWYWTGQDVWDAQVTNAANKGIQLAHDVLESLVCAKTETTGPTIFIPWVHPANPGGKAWGQGGLTDAAPDATFHTFIYDVSGVKKVIFHYSAADGPQKQQISMENRGSYPSHTNPKAIASLYTAVLPSGTGDIRYYIEAVDQLGNVSFSPVGRIYIA